MRMGRKLCSIMQMVELAASRCSTWAGSATSQSAAPGSGPPPPSAADGSLASPPVPSACLWCGDEGGTNICRWHTARSRGRCKQASAAARAPCRPSFTAAIATSPDAQRCLASKCAQAQQQGQRLLPVERRAAGARPRPPAEGQAGCCCRSASCQGEVPGRQARRGRQWPPPQGSAQPSACALHAGGTGGSGVGPRHSWEEGLDMQMWGEGQAG